MRTDLGFHSKDGWHFKRQDDGSVRIAVTTWDGESVLEEITLDGRTWASAMASVSHRGETGETFNEAILFHGGPVQNVAPDGQQPSGPTLPDPATGEPYEVSRDDLEP